MKVVHILTNGTKLESVSGKIVKVPTTILANEKSRPARSRKNLEAVSQIRKEGEKCSEITKQE